MLSQSRYYYCSERSFLSCKRFLSLTRIKRASCSLFSFCKFLVALSHPGTLVSVIEAVPAYCRQHCLSKVYMHISFSLRIVEDTELHKVIQVSNPSIRPITDKLRLPVSRIILPSVSDGRKFSRAFCSASTCVTSFQVMRLPWVWATLGTSCRDWRCTKRCFRNLDCFLDSVDRVRVEL